MGSPDQWKDKYFRQLEDQEQAEKRWEAERHALQRLLVRTSLAAEGQSSSLDRLLGQLRGELRREQNDPGGLRAMQRDLDELVVGLDEARARHVERVRQALQQLLTSLGQLDSQRSLRRELKTLDRALAGNEIQLNGLDEWLERLVQLQITLLDRLQGDGNDTEPERNGFWRRFFTAHEAAPPSPEETGGEPVVESFPPEDGDLLRFIEHVSRLIGQLLAQVSFPPTAEEEARRLQARVLEVRQWQDLDQALDTVAGLVIAAVGRSQQEFEEFLQRLDERLLHIQGYFQAQQDSQQDRRSASDELGRDVTEQLRSMGDEVSRASDLARLKVSVNGYLDRIGRSLELFRARESEQEALMAQHVGALQEKLAALEAQSEQMRLQLQQERSRALTDVLTGLPNREAWEERLAQEYERWKRYRQPVSLVIIDIDHFKSINDNYGHLAGDKAIRLIGRSLRDRLRSTDFVARYGGEEFSVLMPETPIADAVAVIDGLRAYVGALPFHFRGNQVNITFSAGVVGFDRDSGAAALFERADQALYRAKESGRDRVIADGSEA